MRENIHRTSNDFRSAYVIKSFIYTDLYFGENQTVISRLNQPNLERYLRVRVFTYNIYHFCVLNATSEGQDKRIGMLSVIVSE